MSNDTPQPASADDPRPTFAEAARLALAVVREVQPEQINLPTPCTGMNVRELIDHLGMAIARVTAAGSRVPLDRWPTEGFSLGENWAAAFAAEADKATQAWNDDRLDEEVTLPWTVTTGAAALGSYVNEVLVHTWDLATATDQSPEWDDDVVETALACIRVFLPDAERGPMWEAFRERLPDDVTFDPPFADAVPVAAEAPAIDRLVAWNGRRP